MTDQSKPRRPRAFAADDPAVVIEPEPGKQDAPPSARPPEEGAIRVRPTAEELGRGFRWGALFLSALVGLASLAAGLAFARFVSSALLRDDWVGWLAFGLAVTAAVSLLAILLKELWGLSRLARLTALRKDVEAALRDADFSREKRAVASLGDTFKGRPELRWGLARLREHAGDVQDPGDLLRLADREILSPLDVEARRTILKSAKRVATVTALSPMVSIAMLFVLVENLSLMRRLAGLYGGRPGTAGTMKLARQVIGHIIATGGVAMTDDLLGQFLGQDLLRRLSRRLGEGVFNGALTARLGVAAVHVIRPLPFLDSDEIRVRDLIPEIFRRATEAPPDARNGARGRARPAEQDQPE